MMQFRVVIVVLMLALSGCAALGPPVLKGHSGPIAWEVADVVQGSQERGTQLRWDYSVVLHNTGSRGIYLERLEISASGRDLYGGMGTERLGRRLEPDGTYRLTRWDTYGCPQCPPGALPGMFSQGLTKELMIYGLEDGGGAIKVQIRIPLNSSVGVASSPTSTPSTAMPSAPIDLTGSYRGTLTGLQDDRSYFDQVTVAVMQNGKEFSGTWTTPTASGTLTGTVVDRTNFTFRLHQDIPCVAEFGGVGTINESGSRLAASYRGGSCQGGNVAASIVVTRGPK